MILITYAAQGLLAFIVGVLSFNYGLTIKQTFYIVGILTAINYISLYRFRVIIEEQLYGTKEFDK